MYIEEPNLYSNLKETILRTLSLLQHSKGKLVNIHIHHIYDIGKFVASTNKSPNPNLQNTPPVFNPPSNHPC